MNPFEEAGKTMNLDLSILSGYPGEVIHQVETLIEQKRLGLYLSTRYPEGHTITTDKALFAYVQEIKKRHMQKAPPVHRVRYDDRIDTVNKALGLHNFVSRVQGKNLKARSEILIASLFKRAPAEFLHMIVVHELAHLKEKEHNKEFYRLCRRMESDYDQLEFDLRLYLISLL